MIYAKPGETYTAVLNAGAAGLVGTLTVQLERADGTTATPATKAGIVEVEPGVYAKDDLVAPNTAGTYIVVWDVEGQRAAEELIVTYDLPAPGAVVPTGAYVSVEELRAEAEVTESVLPNPTAAKLIRLATAIVENALGDRPRQTSGPQQGLKIAEADVLDWQWQRLRETILILGVRFFENPDLVRGIVWDSVSGPDFSRSGGSGKIFGNEAALMFASTGLMPRGARARA